MFRVQTVFDLFFSVLVNLDKDYKWERDQYYHTGRGSAVFLSNFENTGFQASDSHTSIVTVSHLEWLIYYVAMFLVSFKLNKMNILDNL